MAVVLERRHESPLIPRPALWSAHCGHSESSPGASSGAARGPVMKIVALGVLVGLALAAAACAGKSEDPSQGDEQDIKSSSTAKQGESCGGNILGAEQCASGLTCVFPQSHIAGTPGPVRRARTRRRGKASPAEATSSGRSSARPASRASSPRPNRGHAGNL
jgi:hypothetical protein